MFNFRRISINRVVARIVELGTPSLVLIVAMGRIGPLFQSRLLNKFGPLGTFAGFVVSAIHKFGSEALFNTVLEQLKKRGKTEAQILAEIESYPIPEWLKLAVRSYIENVDFETVASEDLSDRDQELFGIIQESIGEDFEQLELNITEKIDDLQSQHVALESRLNEKIDDLQSQFVALESRLNDRIDRSARDLKRFIGRAVAVGAVCTMGVVAVCVFIF